jgi:SAM-dependent methyltransferase
MNRLVTRSIHSPEELIGHFDRVAPKYEDTHGHAERLLRYRLSIIQGLLGEPRIGTLLEIGCGKAIHLIGLAGRCERAIGADASSEMVRIARRDAATSRWRERLELRVDPAETLATVPDRSVDAVLCVGALEHMLDRPRVLAQVRRVLKAGGRFVCLTPNGDYCWYRSLAPRLGLDTRHLSTDRFLTAVQLRALVKEAGLRPERLKRWRFIPKGDIPDVWGGVLHGLDWAGQVAGAQALRGGLALLARRAQ